MPHHHRDIVSMATEQGIIHANDIIIAIEGDPNIGLEDPNIFAALTQHLILYDPEIQGYIADSMDLV